MTRIASSLVVPRAHASRRRSIARAASLVGAALLVPGLVACTPPTPNDDAGTSAGEGEGEREARDCSWDDLVESGSILTPQPYTLPADCDGPAAAPAANTIAFATDEASFTTNFRCTAVDPDLNFATRYVAALPMIADEELTVVVEVDGEVTFALTDEECAGDPSTRAWTYFTYTSGPFDDHWVETCVEEDC